MKRLVLPAFIVGVLLIFSPDATAQTPSWQHQLYVNAGPQFATGSASDAYDTGFGFDVGYYYRANRAFFIGVAGGFHQFSADATGDLSVVPLNIAAKYNFSLTGIQPYIGAEAGPFVLSNGESETKFGIAPRFGLRIPIARGLDIDVNVKYDVLFADPDNFTYIGINGGIAYILDRANLEGR